MGGEQTFCITYNCLTFTMAISQCSTAEVLICFHLRDHCIKISEYVCNCTWMEFLFVYEWYMLPFNLKVSVDIQKNLCNRRVGKHCMSTNF